MKKNIVHILLAITMVFTSATMSSALIEPDPPVPISPADEEELDILLPEYKWSAVDDAEKYELSLFEVLPPTYVYTQRIAVYTYNAADVDNGDGTCSKNPGRLLYPEYTYEWNVKVKNQYYWSKYSEKNRFTVTEDAEVNCLYTLDPIAQAFNYLGGDSSFNVSSFPNFCRWSAVSFADWITITSDSESIQGNGTVTYSVDANPSEEEGRSSIIFIGTIKTDVGTITIDGNTIIITIIDDETEEETIITITIDGNTITIAINDNEEEETILDDEALSGTINETILIPIDDVGTIEININGEAFTVFQNKPLPEDCGYTVSPTSKTFELKAGSGTITVTTGFEFCPWSVLADSDWITITSITLEGADPIEGTPAPDAEFLGDGTVSYSVSAGRTDRTGKIYIADESVTIRQREKSERESVVEDDSKWYDDAGCFLNSL